MESCTFLASRPAVHVGFFSVVDELLVFDFAILVSSEFFRCYRVRHFPSKPRRHVVTVWERLLLS